MRNAKKGLKKVASLNDLLFPVVMIECTDYECNTDYRFDIFVFPYSKEIEVKKTENFKAIENVGQLALNSVNPENQTVANDGSELYEWIESIETFDLINVPDPDRKLRVNSCSDRYELIPNSSIFPAIENILLTNGIAYTANYSMLNYSRFYVEYVIEDQRFAYPVGTGDYVKPVIKVQHSYNGQTKYSITVGYFRLVCTNGLVIAIEDMNEFNLNIVGKHTANIINSLNRLENVLHMFENNSTVLQTIVSKYQMLNASPVINLKSAIEKALKNSGITAVENKNLNTIDTIYNHIVKEMEKPVLNFNGTYTNWHVYNGINAYLYNDSLNIATPEIRVNSDQNVFEYLLGESKKYLNRDQTALN